MYTSRNSMICPQNFKIYVLNRERNKNAMEGKEQEHSRGSDAGHRPDPEVWMTVVGIC